MKTTTNYPLEFKKSSARLAATSDQPMAQTARDLGVNANTLYDWVGKYYKDDDVLKPQSKLSLEEDNKRLRKEVIRLTEERNILKKAAAYFANEAL